MVVVFKVSVVNIQDYNYRYNILEDVSEELKCIYLCDMLAKVRTKTTLTHTVIEGIKG
jgi:hypothetical protein